MLKLPSLEFNCKFVADANCCFLLFCIIFLISSASDHHIYNPIKLYIVFLTKTYLVLIITTFYWPFFYFFFFRSASGAVTSSAGPVVTKPTKPAAAPAEAPAPSADAPSADAPVTTEVLASSPCPKGYKLAWGDEFDSAATSFNKWNYELYNGCQYGICGWGNSELEWYTNRTDNANVALGKLVISARTATAAATPHLLVKLRKCRSGMI